MKNLFTFIALFIGLHSSAQLTNFEWAERQGGTGTDRSNDIVSDNAGNTFTTGSFSGSMTVGGTTLSSNGATDCYVIKRNASGAVLWAKSWGGTNNDEGLTIDLDAAGNILLGGVFLGGVDFNPGTGTFNLTAAGIRDGYVLKLNAAGNFVWAVKIGGVNTDYVRDITTDAVGNVYVGGQFQNTMNFTIGSTPISLTSAGGYDIFLLRFSSAGALNSSQVIGGTGDDAINSIELDNLGNIYSTGYFNNTVDFNPGTATNNLLASNRDAFIAKYTVGGAYLWAHKIGGTSNDLGIVVRATGSDILVGGYYKGSVDFNPGSSTNSSTAHSSSSYNGFIVKYTGQGNYIWHAAVNSTITSRVNDIQVNSAGQTVVYGNYNGNTLFSGNTTAMSSSNQDAYIWYLNPSGLFEARYRMGSITNETPTKFAQDGSDNLYFTGSFAQPADMNVLPGTFTLGGLNNGTDGFVMKYRQIPCTNTFSPTTYVTACTSFSPATSNKIWTTSGNHKDTILNAAGCDSIITYELTIVQPTSSTLNPTACGSWVSPNNTTYTSSGTYTNVLTNAAGCDSTITINLTVNQPTSSTISPTACGSYLSPNNTIYTSSGTYTNVITNAAGCDSTITINLTMGLPTNSTINPTACGSYVSPDNTTYTNSGTYTNVINNAAGCDSTITINLTINQPSTSTINPTACDSWVSPDNTTYTSSGTYTNLLTNAVGCDSTITINLTISPSPSPSISFNGTELSVANTYTSYEWKRNGMVITGATIATYTPTQNGNYEVTVSNADNCTGSDTFNLTNVSVTDFNMSSLSVYPNPAQSKIQIGMKASTVQIRNLQGALLLESTDTETMNVASLANGIYVIYATLKGQQFIGKFVKQ